jgi:WD40 repeat protein
VVATIGRTVTPLPALAKALSAALLTATLLLPGMAVAQSESDTPTLVVEIGSHSAPARRIDVHAARGLAVTASDDRTARVWDLATGELRHVLRPLAYGALGGEVGRLYGAAIHPSEPLVAVAGTSSAPGVAGTAHLIYLFDLDSGTLRRTIDAKAGDIRKLVWSADGTVLLAGYNGTHGVRAFALDGRELLDDRFSGPVFGVAVGAGNVAAAVGLDGTLRTYRVGAGAASVAGTLSIGGKRPAGVSYSPDGTRLAVAYATPRESPEILDAATLRVLARLDAPVLRGGDWRVIAWSADGRRIHIGGTAYTERLRFPVVEFDAASGRAAATIDAAGDSITDLVALPDGRVAFTSFDASWGVIAGGQVARRVGAPVVTVRGDTPLDLELSADARALRWGMQTAGGGFGFAFEKRRLQAAPGTAYRAPETRFGVFNAPSDWNQDSRPPVIGGRAMALAPDERGRALAVLRDGASAAIVGTNRALYRVSEQGAVLWRMPVDTEIRALNTSADGRLVVSAMADGTVRWWRARDGRLILTLLAQAGGQWVIWTPGGYYDASTGADRVVGWALPRGQQQAMSYFSLNRFRDRFLRPDVIDAVFQHLDDATAVAALAKQAEAARVAQEREARTQAEAARATEQRAADEARRAAQREAELRAAVEQATRDAAARAEAQRRADAEAARATQEAQAEQARIAERARLALQRENELRAQAEAAARDSAARAEAARQAEARRQAAAAQAQAEREAAAREAERRVAEAREAAERERQLREATARAEQERVAEARRQEQLRVAEREAARQEAARRQAEAREAETRERAQREAALEAQRLAARLEQARAAAFEAAVREEAAKAAAREATERAAAEKARRELQALKAIEFPPTLQPVAQPKLRAPVGATEVSLPFALLSAAAAGDVTIQLRVNGRPVPAGEIIMPRSVDGRTQGTVKLPSAALLEARSQVELIASNRFGLSEALAFTVDRDFPPGQRPPSGDLYVLAIGVAEYARKDYNLGLAAKDARDFAAAMAQQEGRLYKRVIVRTLANQQATRAAVLRELDTLRSSVTSNDVAMVFIAGHGMNDDTGNYYFLPHDGQHERLASTAVPQAALVSGLAKIRGKTILFVDTCFAGNALGALAKVTRATEGLINDLSSSENGVVVFASSTGQEESEEKDEWGNGAFTKAVLEGLAGKADFTRAGRVTYAALNLFVSEEVTRLTSGRQRPVFISPRGIPDFALARL